jgi:hypothetical protein
VNAKNFFAELKRRNVYKVVIATATVWSSNFGYCHPKTSGGRIGVVKYWEIIADNLKKRGWSLGYVSAIDSCGRRIWIADAHRGDGKRFVVRADEKLTAFVELDSAIRPRGELA